MTTTSVPMYFGSHVFNEDMMQQRLPKDVYKSLRKTIDSGKDLDITVANAVANAMKDWALELGATHFTHWFQPMTGVTAEKHDSFISPTADGRIIMEFSGKELIKGEPDASSFPSGGLRTTFEARGYTAWDPTSYAFIKDNSLYIPTAFCSYGGETLDKKTPLLRSMETINTQALRVLRLFGDQTTKRVFTTVGAEQEYFLIDKEYYDKRDDLMFCGRTLFGAKAPKGQEMDDHYFGAIKPRVSAFMKEIDEELWKLGILSKTKHNEVAPAQHELAPIFTTTNLACDQNQLTMEIMKNVAKKHGLVCLLHEKPFAGVNGSGKHNNWALATDSGKNLLNPGHNPQDNAQFLIFLSAVIKAVDEYADLLRISAASAGNDHRLGANEAPPAIMSIFLGDELTGILDAMESGTLYTPASREELEIGVHVLPTLPKDTTDRNRTSPFAFTGNKFEFRSLGSNFSVSGANTVLNTAVAQQLKEFADELEKADDFKKALNKLVKRVYKEHKRIVFNEDGYSEEWLKTAESRGLMNLTSTVDAIPQYIADKNIKLFCDHKVYTEIEIHSRYEIMLEVYCKTVNIEALTMSQIAKKQIIPAVSRFTSELAQTVKLKKDLLISCKGELTHLENLSNLLDQCYAKTEELDRTIECVKAMNEPLIVVAEYYKDSVINAMNELRATVDLMEEIVEDKAWPLPSYAELMFKI